MAFNATLLAIPTKKLSCDSILSLLLPIVSKELAAHGLSIERMLSVKEYIDSTKSTKVDRYVRIIEKRDDKKSPLVVKADDTPYEGGAFTAPSSTMLCICETKSTTDERLIAVWINFSKMLTMHLPHLLDEFSFTLGKELSIQHGLDTHVLRATSYSRSEDRYAFYTKGRNANPLSGKGALTIVKNTYGVDINHLMDAIDRCIAIVFAPYDVVTAKEQYEKHKANIELFEKNAETLVIKDKQDGTNMVEQFRAENKVILESLKTHYETLTKALYADPNGLVSCFRVVPITVSRNAVDMSEHIFGIPRER